MDRYTGADRDEVGQRIAMLRRRIEAEDPGLHPELLDVTVPDPTDEQLEPYMEGWSAEGPYRVPAWTVHERARRPEQMGPGRSDGYDGGYGVVILLCGPVRGRGRRTAGNRATDRRRDGGGSPHGVRRWPGRAMPNAAPRYTGWATIQSGGDDEQRTQDAPRILYLLRGVLHPRRYLAGGRGAWPAAVLFVIVGIAFAVASYRIGVRQKRRREQIRRDAGFTD